MNDTEINTKKKRANGGHDGGRLGFEEELWRASDRLRGHVEPAEYKHVVLGLLFLKYVLDGHGRGAKARPRGRPNKVRLDLLGDPVSNAGPWHDLATSVTTQDVHAALRKALRQAKHGAGAMSDLLDQDFLKTPAGPLVHLLEVVDRIPLGAGATQARDILGRVYEYFLGKFASREGRSGGEYYTPRSVVQLLVDMVRPFKGTVYDPCCGTAGMFVQSEHFVSEHGGDFSDVRLFGQESSARTLRIARMNLAIRGLPANLGETNADTFRQDHHPRLKADYILANPPFNAKEWGARELATDRRWTFGMPPEGNANFAWVQHIYSHLADDGVAGFVLSNGSLSSNQGGELEIRQRMVEADVVECIVTLPSQLFYGTQIPACLWFISPNKGRNGARHLKGRTLFIDARRMGQLVDRVHAELTAEEREMISKTYLAWRADDGYADIPGFAYSATGKEIEWHRYAFVPGRYVGFPQSDTYLDWREALSGLNLGVASQRLKDVELAGDTSLAALAMLRHG